MTYYVPFDAFEEPEFDDASPAPRDPNWITCQCGHAFYGMTLFLRHAATCEPDVDQNIWEAMERYYGTSTGKSNSKRTDPTARR